MQIAGLVYKSYKAFKRFLPLQFSGETTILRADGATNSLLGKLEILLTGSKLERTLQKHPSGMLTILVFLNLKNCSMPISLEQMSSPWQGLVY